jgi:hypothetical protein
MCLAPIESAVVSTECTYVRNSVLFPTTPPATSRGNCAPLAPRASAVPRAPELPRCSCQIVLLRMLSPWTCHQGCLLICMRCLAGIVLLLHHQRLFRFTRRAGVASNSSASGSWSSSSSDRWQRQPPVRIGATDVMDELASLRKF